MYGAEQEVGGSVRSGRAEERSDEESGCVARGGLLRAGLQLAEGVEGFDGVVDQVVRGVWAVFLRQA